MFGAIKRAVLPNQVLYPVPSKAWFDYAELHHGIHTPDACILDEYQFQLMFIYNGMMRNMPHHEHIGDGSDFLSYAFTKNDYRMFKKDLGQESFPVMLEAGDDDYLREHYAKKDQEERPILRGPAMVRGELYKVRPQQFRPIDTYMDNGVLFKRRRIRLLVPSKTVISVRERVVSENIVTKDFKPRSIYYETEEMDEVRAWCYIGTEHWNDQVADDFLGYSPPAYLLPPLPIYRPHNKLLKPYYYFNRQELNGHLK